jgi:amino acid permease
MFSYPLQVHPCRASVNACLKWRPRRRSARPETSPSRNTLLNGVKSPSKPVTEISDLRFAIITTVIIVLSFITAMTVSSLEKVLAYVGSTGSTTISFILPGLFYYKISDPESTHHQRLVKEDDDEDNEFEGDAIEVNDGLAAERGMRNWRRGLLRKLSLALAIYGCVVMIVCLVTNTFFIVAH